MLELIHVSHSLQDRDTVQYWTKILNILFASQGHKRLDNFNLTLVGNYLHLLLLHSDHLNQNQYLGMRRLRPGKTSGCIHSLAEGSLEHC